MYKWGNLHTIVIHLFYWGIWVGPDIGPSGFVFDQNVKISINALWTSFCQTRHELSPGSARLSSFNHKQLAREVNVPIHTWRHSIGENPDEIALAHVTCNARSKQGPLISNSHQNKLPSFFCLGFNRLNNITIYIPSFIYLSIKCLMWQSSIQTDC